jgi:hypothetical protein
MATNAHPRLYKRAAPDHLNAAGAIVRVLVYVPSPIRASWIEAELAHRSVIVQIGFSVDQVVSALVEDPPPRPQVLVADFDAMGPGELMQLHVLRDRGWFGRIIALGDLPPSLRSSLAIDRVLGTSLIRNALREVINIELIAPQARIPLR